MTQNTLVEQKQAVSLFLESLLRDIPEEEPVSAPPLQAVVDVAASTAETAPAAEVAQNHNKIIEKAAPAQRQPIIPPWAKTPFEALVFKVAGLSLAVPLVELSGVLEWPETITELPGYADFYIGVCSHQGKNVPVVDTAQLVFPAERREDLLRHNARRRSTHIILIDNAKYGLSCDGVGAVLTLDPAQVKWRSAHTKRKWLSGTVIEHMCALVDTKSFVETFLQRH